MSTSARIAEIKDGLIGIPAAGEVYRKDMEWLIAELERAREALGYVVFDCEEGAWTADDMKHMTGTRIYSEAKEALRPSSGEGKDGI